MQYVGLAAYVESLTGVVDATVLIGVCFSHFAIEFLQREIHSELFQCMIQFRLGDVAVGISIKYLQTPFTITRLTTIFGRKSLPYQLVSKYTICTHKHYVSK